MGHHTEAFVGIDTSKSRNAIAGAVIVLRTPIGRVEIEQRAGCVVAVDELPPWQTLDLS